MASAEGPDAVTADDGSVLVAHEHGSTCNHRPATASILLSAAKAGDIEALRDAIGRGQSTEEATEDQSTGLWWAARNGDEECVRILIEAGADVNAAGFGGLGPLHQAARNGHAGVVRLLLAAADVDANMVSESGTYSALIFASRNGHTEIVEQLLAIPGINVDQLDAKQTTALGYAKGKRHARIVALLEARGARYKRGDLQYVCTVS